MTTAMCRICLSENKQMNSIVNTDLQYMYEKLTEYKFVTDDRPLLACFICYARLKHCHELMIKCFQSEEVLTRIIINGYQDHLKKYQQSHLNTLAITAVTLISVSGEIQSAAPNLPNGDVAPKSHSVDDTLVSTPHSIEDILPSTSYNLDEIMTMCNDQNVKQESSDFDYDDAEVKVEIEIEEHELPSPVLSSIRDATSWSESELLTNESIKKSRVRKKQKRDSATSKEKVGTDEVGVPKISKGGGYKITEETRLKSKSRPDNPFKCNSCQKSYTQKCHLSRHFREVHGTGVKKWYTCDICPSKFQRKDVLRKHKLIHADDKPYKCNVCDRGFTEVCNFKKHFRLHTGERPYVCRICHIGFVQQSDLNYHMHNHTGDKPFQCDICDKRFILKSAMTTHRRTHTGERPYECDICKRSFGQKGYLKYHLQTHNKKVSKRRHKSNI